MRDGVMLYKSPGPHVVDGKSYCYLVVHRDDVDGQLAEGWTRTVEDAVEAERERNAPAPAIPPAALPAETPAQPDPVVAEEPQRISDVPEAIENAADDQVATEDARIVSGESEKPAANGGSGIAAESGAKKGKKKGDK